MEYLVVFIVGFLVGRFFHLRNIQQIDKEVSANISESRVDLARRLKKAEQELKDLGIEDFDAHLDSVYKKYCQNKRD